MVRKPPQHFRNAPGVMSPFSRLIGDVNGVLALPISDYEQRQVRLLDRSQDRRRAMSSFRVNLGYPILTDGIFSVRGGDAAHPKLLWEFLFSVRMYRTTTRMLIMTRTLRVHISCNIEYVRHQAPLPALHSPCQLTQ